MRTPVCFKAQELSRLVLQTLCFKKKTCGAFLAILTKYKYEDNLVEMRMGGIERERKYEQ